MKTAYYIQNKKEGKFIFKYLKINGKPFGTGYIIKTYNSYIWSLDCPDDCDDTVSVKFLMSLDNQKLEKRISKLESKVEGLITQNLPKSELTELPEKWCVKVKKNNSEIILNWFEKKLNRDIYGPKGYAHYPEFERQVCTSGEIKDGYTEITFSDFERLVLKKELLEKLYKLEVGKCYKTNDSTGLFYIKEITNGISHSFGFNNGDWKYIWNLSEHKIKKLIPATAQEVEEALKNEAVKRGFKKGINIKTPNGTEGTCKNGVLRYDKILNYLFIDEYACFVEGKWAEVVQDTHDDVYVKGVWDEFLKKEIDWSIPGQKVISPDGLIVFTVGDFDFSANVFSGIVLNKGESNCDIGEYSVRWNIPNFKLHTNPVTI